MINAITRRERVRYGFLALPLAFAGIPLYIHAPDFYATQLGLPLTSLGALLLLLRFFDALQDPIIGHFSDAYARYRLPVLLGAALLLAVGFAALFHPPQQSDNTWVWFAASMLLATTAYSILSVNLNSIGGLWSDDYHTKTRITSTRETFGLLGLLIAVAMPGVLQNHWERATVFSAMSAALTALLVVAMLLFVPWYRRTMSRFNGCMHSPDARGFRALFKALPSESRRFFAVYGVSMLASSIPAVLILFFVRDRLNAENWAGAFLTIYFLAAIAAMPLWQFVSRRHNKAQAWFASMLLALVSFIWAFFLGEGDVVAFGLICLLSGIAFGAELALPPSILADLIQKYEQHSSTSLQFSLLTFLLKTAAALASLLVFGLLDFVGLKPGEANSAPVLFYLSLSYALIPCVIKAVAAILLHASLTSYFKGDQHVQNLKPYRSSSHG